MSVVGPVTKSPQANTPRTFVAYVAGSTLTRPRLISKLGLDRQEGQVGGLGHGRDDGLGRDDELGALDRDRRAAAGGVRLAEAVADELDAGDLAVLAEDLDRAGEELHPDAFALGLAQLLLVDDELGAGAPVDDRDVGRRRGGGSSASSPSRCSHRR